MVFSDHAFLFSFLPLVFLAYFGLGRRWHNAVLVVFSLSFYTWGEKKYVVVLLVSIVLNWAFAKAASGGRASRSARIALPLAIAANLLLLGGLKYANFVVDNLNVLLAALSFPPLLLGKVHLPIGISFFCFQGMSYVIDVYRGVCPPQQSLLNFAMYKSFFPQLIAGPIVRYADVKQSIEERTVTADDFAAGIRRFVLGLGKKMVIADVVARPVDAIFALPVGQLTPGLAWLAVIGYAIQIYFDFSAYSDMAIGLGRMFGFRFLENFNYPYIAGSMTDFWRRWHISLSTWFRDYVYIPLGGNRARSYRVYLNLLIVFLLCGLWHGASWNFLVWGLFHGAFLMLERAGVIQPERFRFKPLRHVYVLGVVLVGWVFFRIDTAASACSFLNVMAGRSNAGPVVPDIRLYVDLEVLLGLALGIIGSMPVFPWLAARVDRLRRDSPGLEAPIELAIVAGIAAIVLYSAMLMAAGSYSPFIYFRF
jgi:alginate O-acetyltransferase complex protein AlgI